MSFIRRVQSRLSNLLPLTGFYFDRPIVLLQSDDWGRVGLRDREGLEELRCAGIILGERPYDLYTLETAEDLSALAELLQGHRDSVGRHPCLEMNFVSANLDFQKAAGSGHISFIPLADGFPQGWHRPNLIDGYRSGISDGFFSAALHGMSHFCRASVERAAMRAERGDLLRTLWRSGTPYIHWRMPWVGYEYWDPEKGSEELFLDLATQQALIGQTVGFFTRLISSLPLSACAPGYRANDDTHRAWSEHGIRIAQNGPGRIIPPHFWKHELLHLTRAVEFEPATDPAFSLELCLSRAERCFELGIPAIVSIHSINFHSTVEDFRSRTLGFLDQFFAALESRHSELLYLRDQDLFEAIQRGQYEAAAGSVKVNVSQKKFRKATAVRNAP
jgi:hypothetical protein